MILHAFKADIKEEMEQKIDGLLDYGKKPTETLELYDYVEFMWWEMWWNGHFKHKTVRIPPSPPVETTLRFRN